ncbi:MAG TPA: RNA polymerase sigma-70 factor [Microlunatus sp.]|nr:RNA polymerase sigma-70 factor [Microlunatus sp.]
MTETRSQQDLVNEELFDEHRSLLFTVSYELLGSVADAEDVVQETYLRWSGRPADAEVANPRAYLAQIATRLSLNRLRALARQREDYVGPWLPEPLLTAPDVAEDVVLAESVSLALMVILESLGPKERAVFLLREVFGYEYAEVGEALGMSPAAARQTAHRAKQHVEARRPRFETDDQLIRQVYERFNRALLGGDVQGLMDLLAPDVVVLSDGGGVVRSARRPVQGADAAARLLVGTLGKAAPGLRVEPAMINGVPGWRAWEGDQLAGCLQLVITDDKIAQVLIVINPEKLGGLDAPRTIAR